MNNFILASASPRRRELLGELGITPRVCPTDADETIEEKVAPSRFVEILSKRKADAYTGDIGEDDILIASDTVVALGDIILGKPADRQDAFDMLKSLSGKAHSVFTGITVKSKEKSVTTHDETKVYFREMGDDEIWAYVDSGDPMDKAGSYGIQGEAGKFVSAIEGSLNNVIGLPTELLKEILTKDFNIGDLK
ncbi:MAG: septum formation protein Maf [Clostridia bacterium]|nr:septum formation protein Maf [Clostridia bacterium]